MQVIILWNVEEYLLRSSQLELLPEYGCWHRRDACKIQIISWFWVSPMYAGTMRNNSTVVNKFQQRQFVKPNTLTVNVSSLWVHTYTCEGGNVDRAFRWNNSTAIRQMKRQEQTSRGHAPRPPTHPMAKRKIEQKTRQKWQTRVS